MNLKKIGIIGILLTAVIFAGYYSFYQESQRLKEPLEKVILGTSPTEAAALLFLAYDLGYFADNGLEVELKQYPVVNLALQDLFAGNLDVAFSGEYSAVVESFRRDDFRILASIDSGRSISVVARKDHQIKNPEDLKNKKIGVLTKSSPEFLLLNFLLAYRLQPSDVEIVNINTPGETISSLIEGDVDAVVIWNPPLKDIVGQLGDKVVIWDIQENQDYFMLLFSRKEFAKSSQHIIKKLLQAIGQAENFIQQNPAEAQSLLAKRFNYEKSYLASLWNKHHYNLALTQSLILLMEDEARWAIQNNLTDAPSVPNYLNYISMDALAQVKPEAITIIR